MADSFQELLQKKLEARERAGLMRFLKKENPALIDFASNDYLGLARSSELQSLIDAEMAKHSFYNGSTGSRLLTGNLEYTQAVEHYLAGFFQSKSALIFNSGYTANLAVLSSLPGKNDTIIYDELAHACIKDGARLSLAKRFSFRHNDLADLESKLGKATGQIYIAIESIYSMDGDEAPLKDIAALAKSHGAVIVLDEAHSTGVAGKDGRGLAVDSGLKDLIAIRIYTFGKAMGVHGACVAGSAELQQYLINFARPFIYTTALNPHSVASIYCAFKYREANQHLQNQLGQNIEAYQSGTSGIENKTKSHSAIQTMLIRGNERVRAAAKRLQLEGLDVRPILSPTVAVGTERLRICLHAYNTSAQIEKLCSLLQII
jgi:8-amino-7-oxononanoate synthase